MTDAEGFFAVPPFGGTLAGLLVDRAERYPDRVLLDSDLGVMTTAQVAAAARDFADRLHRHGIRPGDKVLTMRDAGPDYVALVLGLALVGAVWVPQAPDARGPSLAHVLTISKPVLVIATPEAAAAVAANCNDAVAIETEGWDWPSLPRADLAFRPEPSDPDTVRAVLFTSGTTGPPKGVIVTERMLLASAAGCAFASECRTGDVFLMWEPMHHIGGPQLVVMALVHGARLIVVERFSASRFWPLVRAHGVTKLHYLGGILEILLKAQDRPDDRDHPVSLAFGGGCRPETRRDFVRRFGIPIREVYGMTEASSFTTVDDRQTADTIGQALPWMEVALLGDDGKPVDVGEAGEIAVRPRHHGLLTPGYLEDPQATDRLLRDGWLFTGDLARCDSKGNFSFLGRKTDSLRRRGENVSAWEIETALSAHPDIAETAIVGVPARIGEADILCFVLMREGVPFDSGRIMEWCRQHLPRRHLPRYWKAIDHFDRTPSQRIRKDRLDTSLHDAADMGDDPRDPA